MTVLHLSVAAIVLTACAFDLQTRRIPNALTLGAAAAGLTFQASTGGWAAAGASAAGWAAGCALFFPLFALRGMGAGDVKLLAAVGAWVGPLNIVWVALITSVAGGALAVAVALAHGYLPQALLNIRLLLIGWYVSGVRPLGSLTLTDHAGPSLPYALPIAVGALVTMWLAS